VSQSGGCEPGLTCIRVDLVGDSGVCLPIAACSRGADCGDPIRSECYSTLLANVYPAATLKTDHLFCLQTGCLAGFQACQPGTTCLGSQLLGKNLPDICTPTCDSRGRCPPNFTCSKTFLPFLPHPFCVPGLLGFPCRGDLDCVVGKCTAVGNRKVCTLACTDDSACLPYEGDSKFYCDRTLRQCVSPGISALQLCRLATPSDCANGQICIQLVGSDPSVLGLCATPCDANGAACPKQDDFYPQVCSSGVVKGNPSQSVCVPGTFPFLCKGPADCIDGLDCLQPYSTIPDKFCTTTCTTHAQCQSNPRMGGGSYCAGVLGVPGVASVCAPKEGTDGGCVNPIQCTSGQCVLGKCR
jgi:hypothetical protein